MQLNTIRDNKGATSSKKRVGRGIGSGLVKTSGRGHKGQRARNTVRLGFEGGQTVLYRRMPKRGFNNRSSKLLFPLNLEQISNIVKKNSLDFSKQIDLEMLKELKVIKGSYYEGIALLSVGELPNPINIKVNKVSKSAKIKLDKSNSKVEIIENKNNKEKID